MNKKKTTPRFTLVRSLSAEERGIRRPKVSAAPERTRAVSAIAPKPRSSVTRVGIMDLGAWLSGLEGLVVRMNAAQKALRFFEVQAPIPAGLAKRGDHLLAWAEEHSPQPLTPEERSDLKRNVIADAFFVAAETIRTRVGVDYLAGVTPAAIAGTSDGSIYWNHFSSWEGRALIVSTADLREFSAKAKRSFDAAVGGVLMAQLLVAMTYPKIGFHEDRGCIFDYNEDRVGLVKKLKNPVIEPDCLKELDPAIAKAALAILATLKEMPR